jgi:hypothetical protein
MQTRAASFYSLEPDSEEAGQIAGAALLDRLAGEAPKLVLVYATVNHDQQALLRALRGALGPRPMIAGCSVQGAVGNAELTEEGLALAAMAFGGSALNCAAALERDISIDTESKGQALAQSLKKQLGGEPVVTVVLYDPLCGANVEALLAGMRSELTSPIVGGGAGQPWGPPKATFQFWGEEVLSHGVVALGLSGQFAVEMGICHGTSPTGISMTITKSEGAHILEIDGKPALDVWYQSTGHSEGAVIHQDSLAAWALGIQCQAEGGSDAAAHTETVIRGAFGFDPAARAIIVQAGIPSGSQVMFHHRTVEDVLSGTEVMASNLARRLSGRSPWAVLGFECAARTFPFLGPTNTLKEHERLRGAIAPNAPWLGMMAWGEVGPSGGQPAFHNYTYPLVVFTEKDA